MGSHQKKFVERTNNCEAMRIINVPRGCLATVWVDSELLGVVGETDDLLKMPSTPGMFFDGENDCTNPRIVKGDEVFDGKHHGVAQAIVATDEGVEFILELGWITNYAQP